jgi:hypothetical protein
MHGSSLGTFLAQIIHGAIDAVRFSPCRSTPGVTSRPAEGRRHGTRPKARQERAALASADPVPGSLPQWDIAEEVDDGGRDEITGAEKDEGHPQTERALRDHAQRRARQVVARETRCIRAQMPEPEDHG